jgi:tetratricopeptide (TPR) repeat protein
MNKENILFGIIGLLAGLIIGFLATNNYNRSAILSSGSPTIANPTNNPQPSGTNPQAAMPGVGDAIEKADKEPENFDAQFKAGEMFARIKNFEKALSYFEKAQKLKPQDHAILVSLGNTNFDLGKWEDAQKWYESALAVKPDDIASRTDLGITFIERPNPDIERAIKEFESSLKINPNHEATLFNLSIAYFKKGDTTKAQELKGRLASNKDLVDRLDKIFTNK